MCSTFSCAHERRKIGTAEVTTYSNVLIFATAASSMHNLAMLFVPLFSGGADTLSFCHAAKDHLKTTGVAYILVGTKREKITL